MRKMESLAYLKSLGLKTVPTKEFVYSQQREAIAEARRLGRDGRGFNVRTDVGSAAKGVLRDYDLPFRRGCSLDELRTLMDKYRDSLTYLIFETPDNDCLYFNATCCCAPTRDFVADVNYIDKMSNREAFRNARNIVRIAIPPEYGREPVLDRVRGDMIHHKLYNIVEVSAFDHGERIVWWQIKDPFRPDWLLRYPDICRNMGIRHTKLEE